MGNDYNNKKLNLISNNLNTNQIIKLTSTIINEKLNESLNSNHNLSIIHLINSKTLFEKGINKKYTKIEYDYIDNMKYLNSWLTVNDEEDMGNKIYLSQKSKIKAKNLISFSLSGNSSTRHSEKNINKKNSNEYLFENKQILTETKPSKNNSIIKEQSSKSSSRKNSENKNNKNNDNNVLNIFIPERQKNNKEDTLNKSKKKIKKKE